MFESVFLCWNGAKIFVTASNLPDDDEEEPEPEAPAVAAFVSTGSGLCFEGLEEGMMVARVHVRRD